MMNQKTAVYQAVTATLTEYGTHFEDGMNVAELIKPHRQEVIAILVEGFSNKQIQLDKEYEPSELKGYASSLLNNWLRKDTRLNGGSKYQAKNPGSRAGTGDEQVKALRALLASGSVTDSQDIMEIETAINSRLAEIQQAKVKATPVNYDALPASIRAKFQRN